MSCPACRPGQADYVHCRGRVWALARPTFSIPSNRWSVTIVSKFRTHMYLQSIQCSGPRSMNTSRAEALESSVAKTVSRTFRGRLALFGRARLTHELFLASPIY